MRIRICFSVRSPVATKIDSKPGMMTTMKMSLTRTKSKNTATIEFTVLTHCSSKRLKFQEMLKRSDN